MAKLFANIGDSDQTSRYAASDLGLHCLPITLLRVSRLQCVKTIFHLLYGYCKPALCDLKLETSRYSLFSLTRINVRSNELYQ